MDQCSGKLEGQLLFNTVDDTEEDAGGAVFSLIEGWVAGEEGDEPTRRVHVWGGSNTTLQGQELTKCACSMGM